ncbi:YgaP family membrane protein [Rhodospirillum rubrum]|uniref:Inner membrane protein YgaP-like transmembrane domain-containing protein n=1 Tax=Rhodospirillum rubrum (strain ATCC 11170 / ATH 1.1.1 / DSM 467 / LMG 4362 / NCIMB 8255 / S1) TaxID=269796 RepID=Q2RXX1_RHORT|nr:DUF2892 domain-containing protein [Rhodospirillum rubrum]ABC21024.1 hypothetical protein Rru_A0219 [Rhodospirillum rubrum ATCC 11170]AEO46690.1 hypothetical protein F11_01100 [Rhodospirillum rubrum F11]MBK5952568.1 DUF2892 domain-containing protein [Rhodospirillum rubrum]QXG80720.1 DUF2892 domain-containing protein [Rhodospirillum rubrum]HAP99068.1 DUF2892 domain-containing protein [Rhodospirillum rubrum]
MAKKKLTKNMGTIDRGLRATLGILLLALAVSETIGSWGYIGVLPLFTSIWGWCPAYYPFGFSTCKTTEHGEPDEPGEPTPTI